MPASDLSAPPPVPPRRKLLAACAIGGLFGAPGIWLLQVIVSEVLSANACYGVSAPRAAPLPSGTGAWVFAISALAVVLSAPCAGFAWYGWRLARRAARDADAQPHPHFHAALRTAKQLRGDDLSRVRFLALCSALVGTGFFVGAIFVWLAPWLVGPCGTGY